MVFFLFSVSCFVCVSSLFLSYSLIVVFLRD